eukprot:gene6379-11817_t
MPRPRKSSYADKRPPFSYIYLCAMAIESAPKKMMTLREIYKFVSENFEFYRKSDSRWKNSLRHNLSFNDCFIKVSTDERRRFEKGRKGYYWTLHPNSRDMFLNGSSLRRQRKFVVSNQGRALFPFWTQSANQPRVGQHPGPMVSPYRTGKIRIEEDRWGCWGAGYQGLLSLSHSKPEHTYPDRTTKTSSNSGLPFTIDNILVPDRNTPTSARSNWTGQKWLSPSFGWEEQHKGTISHQASLGCPYCPSGTEYNRKFWAPTCQCWDCAKLEAGHAKP